LINSAARSGRFWPGAGRGGISNVGAVRVTPGSDGIVVIVGTTYAPVWRCGVRRITFGTVVVGVPTRVVLGIVPTGARLLILGIAGRAGRTVLMHTIVARAASVASTGTEASGSTPATIPIAARAAIQLVLRIAVTSRPAWRPERGVASASHCTASIIGLLRRRVVNFVNAA